ncbi:MAG: NRDE family protein [Planctomycetes bacterium]|nr:NRDE family protein [Planctomycetota bacterium]
MCLLIVLAGIDPDWPVIVASNRDEERARGAAPPGLFVGTQHRMLSPRDRRAGGTWLAVSERRLFAGLTNLSASPRRAGARTRGALPHLALDAADVAEAVALVREELARAVYDGFQLVLSSGTDTRLLEHEDGRLTEHRLVGGALVVSNQHRIGELVLPGLEATCAPGLTLDERLAMLAALLLDEGERSGHRILKRGGEYGTVSSSLIALPAADVRRLVWRYAAGSPDAAPYREYGNLARRLVED